jgi:hypothetical protein
MGETRVGPLPNGCVRLGENASKEHSRGLQPAGAGNNGARGVDAVQLHWHYTSWRALQPFVGAARNQNTNNHNTLGAGKGI